MAVDLTKSMRTDILLPQKPCVGCEHEPIPGIRFAVRGDGSRAIERCDICCRYDTDQEAFEEVENKVRISCQIIYGERT